MTIEEVRNAAHELVTSIMDFMEDGASQNFIKRMDKKFDFDKLSKQPRCLELMTDDQRKDYLNKLNNVLSYITSSKEYAVYYIENNKDKLLSMSKDELNTALGDITINPN